MLQLHHQADNLRQILLLHECFLTATCVDLTVGVCAFLKRHLSRTHKICKYKNFDLVQTLSAKTLSSQKRAKQKPNKTTQQKPPQKQQEQQNQTARPARRLR